MTWASVFFLSVTLIAIATAIAIIRDPHAPRDAAPVVAVVVLVAIMFAFLFYDSHFGTHETGSAEIKFKSPTSQSLWVAVEGQLYEVETTFSAWERYEEGQQATVTFYRTPVTESVQNVAIVFDD